MLTINPTPMARTDITVNTISPTTLALSASNTAAAAILFAPKAGNLSKIGVNVTAITGTSPAYRASVQGVSGHQADGTVLGGGSPASGTFTPVVTGWVWVTLANPIAVTQGQRISLVIDYSSGTVNASNCATVAARITGLANNGFGTPYSASETAGVWSASNSPPAIAGMYDDGMVTSGTFAYSALANSGAWNNTTTGSLFRGSLWIPKQAVRICGAVVCCRPGAASDFNLKLFVGSAAFSASTSVAIATDWLVGAVTAAGYVPLTPTIIPAGSTARLVIEPTTANNFSTFISATMADAASRQAWWGDLSGTQGASGTNPAWADAPNDVYPVIPVIDQIGFPGPVRRPQ